MLQMFDSFWVDMYIIDANANPATWSHLLYDWNRYG